jgi:hypothetical protein
LASARTGNELHRGNANTGTSTWQVPVLEMNSIAAMPILVRALGKSQYGMGTGRCSILELNRARTGIGTVFHVYGTMALDQPQQGEDDQHRHQQTTIKKHRNGGAPSALEDGSGVAGRRQKKAVWWQGRSASTLINNNQQVKQSRVVDNTTSDERRRPTIRREGK